MQLGNLAFIQKVSNGKTCRCQPHLAQGTICVTLPPSDSPSQEGDTQSESTFDDW